MQLNGLNGTLYTTTATALNRGGEGAVFELVGQPALVAKIYNEKNRTQTREHKLIAMLQMQGDIDDSIAWPKDVLYANSRFVGFVMPRVNSSANLKYITALNADLASFCRRPAWNVYVRVALNLASALNNIHAIGQVVGDLNPDNVLVNETNGTIVLIDTDSYHITDSSGKILRCGVARAEYAAPEIQGITFSSAPLPTFTRETDTFCLAVHIFQLLMNGAHPYVVSVSHGSVGRFDPVNNIVSGVTPYFSFDPNLKNPAYAPDIHCLPNDMIEMFRRAFVEGTHTPGARPTAKEWYAVLTRLESSFCRCPQNSSHVYYSGASACPHCDVERRLTYAVGQVQAQQAHMAQPVATQYTVPPVFNPSQAQAPSPNAKSNRIGCMRTIVVALLGMVAMALLLEVVLRIF